MILTDTTNNVDIGSIPANRAKTVDMGIQYLRGRTIGKGDPLWNDKGANVIINGKRYRHEDLAIADQLVTDADIHDMLKRTGDYPDADTYAHDVYLSPYFVDLYSSDSYQPNPRIEGQLRILWHVAHDPFQTLLESVWLTPEQCADRFAIDNETMEGWLSGDVAVQPYVRLMIAEATGLLKLRYW